MHPMTMAIERRHSPRRPAVENVALVRFQRRKRTRTVGACLVDISATGARLRMGEKPRVDGTLWVRLAHPLTTRWLMATVVRIDEEDGVGVAFVRACDRTSYWTATRGADFRADPLTLAEAAKPED
jgi:PilZ domain